MTDVTDRQLDYLKAIHRHEAKTGFHISIRDLGAALGIASTNGVNDGLKILVRKGLVRRGKQARCITLIDSGMEFVQQPPRLRSKTG